MRSVHLIAGAAAFAALAVPAAAKPLPTEQFKASAAIAVDPARAYLLVRSPGMDLKLLRVPTDSERVAYKAERAEALAKAKVKYGKALKSYEEGLKDAEEDRLRGIRPPDKPVEPTEDNFAFRAIESDNFVTIWAGRVFDKGGPRTVHLIAVPPGTYRIYGQVLEGANGSTSGTCLCMGSVQFNATAGMITDMGTIHYPAAEAAKDKVKPSWNGLTPGKGGLTSMRVEPADSSTYVPANLAAMRRVPASYRAAGKIDNFFGIMVDRLTALPGVLSYRRDEVIDEKTAVAVGSD